jgi:caffeoyl-CoA O-methyltransferase
MAMLDEAVTRYALRHTTALEPGLASVAMATERDTPYPQMVGGVTEVRLLQMLVAATDARRVLEIGTFTGLTALALAAVLPADGRVITIESNGDTAAMARANIDPSPDAAKIQSLIGDAREIVPTLDGPFDVVWIDAWKPDYRHYYEAVVPKLAPRGVVVADNVLLGGAVATEGDGGDPASEQLAAIRAFNDHVSADPRTVNALLTVADGLMVAWRAPDFASPSG